ncbi:MAG: hypothetical protein LBG80_04500 [Bacteroidales bacterium]|jgi:hypothetical protein|nr:hypothetical protein [Bacteroidales bacterium]
MNTLSNSRKRNAGIANLVSIGSKIEKEEKNESSINIKPQAIEEENIAEVPYSLATTMEKNKIGNTYQDIFIKIDYGVGETNTKIPTIIHNKFKLLSVHTKVPLQQIIANVLNQFLNENDKNIKRSMKI